MRARFMAILRSVTTALLTSPPEPRLAGIPERPHEEVVANVIVDLGQTEGLDEQEPHDETPVQHERQLGEGGRRDGDVEKGGARPKETVEEDGRQENEAGAEVAADHAVQPTRDHHGGDLDGDVEAELLRSDDAVVREGEHGACDASQERADPEGQPLVTVT